MPKRDRGEAPADRPRLTAIIGARAAVVARIGGILMLCAAATGAVLAHVPLQRHLADRPRPPVTPVFEWPTASARPGNDGEPGTWVRPEIRAFLDQIVRDRVTTDPFDTGSLANAAATLAATGWFADLRSVRRGVGNVVRVDGVWRTPAAVVMWEERPFLVGLDGGLMMLPEGVSPDPGLFRILGPVAGPPRHPEIGQVVYGESWPLDDVPMAIELLGLLASEPESSSIRAVDLSSYASSGRVSLWTDAGCELVWGAPPGESRPGEASTLRKIGHVKTILSPSRRYDRGRDRIDLSTEHVFIDRRPGGDGSI